MTTYTGIVQSIAVQAWEQTFAGPPHRAKSLSTGGIIVIRMSELALKVRGIDADEVHDFIEIVPFGDAEIARLQTGEGHAYLQAHNLAP